jgi:hypothetical protein
MKSGGNYYYYCENCCLVTSPLLVIATVGRSCGGNREVTVAVIVLVVQALELIVEILNAVC